MHVPLFLFPRPDASEVIPLPGDPPSDEDPPSGGDDEEEEPADDPASKEEVATEFIGACDLSALTGQNDDVTPDIFQASVNASFNAANST